MKRRSFYSGLDAKKDQNHAEIVAAFRAAGAKVWQQARPFDLLICVQDLLLLVEIKHGRAVLNDKQVELAKDWPVNIIRTPEEAIAFVNNIRRLAA